MSYDFQNLMNRASGLSEALRGYSSAHNYELEQHSTNVREAQNLFLDEQGASALLARFPGIASRLAKKLKQVENTIRL